MCTMNAVKCSEVPFNGPEGRLCSGHLERATRGHGDTGQLLKGRNQALKKQPPSKDDHNSEFK